MTLLDQIQLILDEKFSEPEKRRIKENVKDLTFACPYCGDSSDPKKKRGTIFFESNFFHCYNCQTHTPLLKFLNDFNVKVSFDLMESILEQQRLNQIKNRKHIDVEYKKYAFPREEFKKLFDFVEIDESSTAKVYLLKRLQLDTSRFLYSPKRKSIVILNDDVDGNIIGFALRTIKKGESRYTLYKLSKIYTMLGKEVNPEIERLDTISMTFNILRIDTNRAITIFEGQFDSFLYPNSIATSGIGKKLKLKSENIRYFNDYDDAGKQNTLNLIKEGQKVFLWKKFLSDYNIPDRNKWDLNDIYKHFYKTGEDKPNFENYFSTSQLDIIWV